jgi:hypothetical protein
LRVADFLLQRGLERDGERDGADLADFAARVEVVRFVEVLTMVPSNSHEPMERLRARSTPIICSQNSGKDFGRTNSCSSGLLSISIFIKSQVKCWRFRNCRAAVGGAADAAKAAEVELELSSSWNWSSSCCCR